MNNLDKTYTTLLQDILDNGVTKSDRTGTGTISVFGRQIRHKMSEGFPLLTTKKMAWKTIVTELLWFLRGDTNIKYLIDNGCHIWVGDCYKNYVNTCVLYPEKMWEDTPVKGSLLLEEEFIDKIKTDDEFAKKWGSLGKIYGKQWRSWTNYTGDEINEGTYEMTNEPIDQISELIKQLKENPDSRRLLVSAWAVHDLPNMVLPPCHYSFQVYTRELSFEERKNLVPPIPNLFTHEDCDVINLPKRAISLMWSQRSCDFFLGLPFNIASYGLLLEILAKEVNMVPDELIGNLGDTHLYLNHIEQAKEQIGRIMTTEERNEWHLINRCGGNKRYCKTDWEYFELDQQNVPQRTREPYPLPTLNINTEFWQTESGECGVGPLKTNLMGFEISDFTLENYQSHPTIKAPLSN